MLRIHSCNCIDTHVPRNILFKSSFRSICSISRQLQRNASCAAGAASNQDGPSVSRRVQETDAPCIVKTKRLLAGVDGALSLAQGVVHWAPPKSALDRAASLISSQSVSSYGPDEGMPDLISALKKKLKQENGLEGYEVMITAGANQGFANLVVALLDPGDSCVLFRPYYFNHLMALQMTGGAASVVLGQCDPASWHPDFDWLEGVLTGPSPPKMVVLVNPCNPTGVLLSKEEVDRANKMCREAGAWLVMDNTYEHFVYEGRQHHCVSGPNVIQLFSFSKAFGMMGWRVGYIAYPSSPGDFLGSQLLKVQDTIPICPPQLSQHVALGAIAEGRNWVTQQVDLLGPNRDAVIDALSPLGALGSGVAGGEGAIYLWAKLPSGCEDDEAVVEWLVRRHGICLIPGSSCGCPGYVRAAFANLPTESCERAAARLKRGLTQLVRDGPAALSDAGPGDGAGGFGDAVV